MITSSFVVLCSSCRLEVGAMYNINHNYTIRLILINLWVNKDHHSRIILCHHTLQAFSTIPHLLFPSHQVLQSLSISWEKVIYLDSVWHPCTQTKILGPRIQFPQMTLSGTNLDTVVSATAALVFKIVKTNNRPLLVHNNLSLQHHLPLQLLSLLLSKSINSKTRRVQIRPFNNHPLLTWWHLTKPILLLRLKITTMSLI